MSEDNEPNRLAELTMPSKAMLREIEQCQQFFRDHGPMIRQAQEAQRFFREHESLIRQVQQLQPLVRQGQALWRQIEPIIKSTEQLTRGGGWPVPPFQQRLMGTVETALRAIQPPTVHAVAHPGAVDISVAAPTAIVVSGSLTLPPMGFAAEGTVEKPDLIERNIGRVFAVVLVAIATAGLLGVQGSDRATVDHWLAVLNFALDIAVLICTPNKQK